MNRTTALVLVLLCATAALRADEVVFKNGDHLTGKLTYDGSKLLIDTPSAGKVEVDLKKVKTIASDGPMDVVLADGTKIHGKAVAGPDGQLTLAPEGDAPARGIAFADVKKINPPAVKWTGSVLVGGTMTRGNTKTESLNAAAHAVLRRENDRTTLDATYLYGREHVPGDGIHETQNNWAVEGKYDYFFSPRAYAYGDVRAERDVIAGLDLRLTPGVGAGYQWVDEPKLKFNTEGGVSYLYRSYSNDGTDESVSLRLAYHFNAKINDKVAFIHDLEYFPGLNRLDNYLITSDAGIRTTLTEKMFAEFRIEWRYDSKPAPGKTYNDLRYILGVGWNF